MPPGHQLQRRRHLRTSVVKKDYSAEQTLISLAQAGDGEAFTRLVERYNRQIYNIGLRMLGNPEDAADMTQDVWLKIYRYLANFRGDSAFSTWLYRIAVNCCRDYLRLSYRTRELPFSGFGEEDESEAVFEIADRSAGPEELYLHREGRDELLGWVAQLSPQFRIVLVLREICGLSYQEIAAAVEISLGTVKSRLARARAALVEKITASREQSAAADSHMDSEDERGRSDGLR